MYGPDYAPVFDWRLKTLAISLREALTVLPAETGSTTQGWKVLFNRGGVISPAAFIESLSKTEEEAEVCNEISPWVHLYGWTLAQFLQAQNLLRPMMMYGKRQDEQWILNTRFSLWAKLKSAPAWIVLSRILRN